MTSRERSFDSEPDDESFAQEVEAARRNRELVRWLARWRYDHGQSQAQVAKRMQTSQPAVARLESHQHDAQLSTLARYVTALGLSLGFVLTDNETRNQVWASQEGLVDEADELSSREKLHRQVGRTEPDNVTRHAPVTSGAVGRVFAKSSGLELAHRTLAVFDNVVTEFDSARIDRGSRYTGREQAVVYAEFVRRVTDRLANIGDAWSTVKINSEAVAQLTMSLQLVTSGDVSNDSATIAQVMADIASIVHRYHPIVQGAPQGSERVTQLVSTIYTELSIDCVIFFARSHGYDMPLDVIPHDQISMALIVQDRKRLVEIFRDALRRVQGIGISSSQEPPGDSADALIQYLEGQFAEESSVPAATSAVVTRKLTAGYWNLRSAAEAEGWSAADVLMLLQEHLSPMLHSHLVHRSSTVSVDGWQRLYDWLHQDGLT